jgi:tetratricopeptide (TPR) repeat protein
MTDMGSSTTYGADRARKFLAEAKTEAERGRVDLAVKHLELAAAFDPTNQEIRQKLVEMRADPRSRTRDLPRPNDEEKNLLQRSREAEESGNIALAMQLLESGLSGSQRARCAFRLGVMAVKHERDLDRGVSLLRQAVEAAPGNASYEKTLARLEERQRKANRTPTKWLSRLWRS